MTEEKAKRQKYVYDVGLVRHQVMRTMADKIMFNSDGVKFYVNGEVVLSVAPQKWNYIERKGMVD